MPSRLAKPTGPAWREGWHTGTEIDRPCGSFTVPAACTRPRLRDEPGHRGRAAIAIRGSDEGRQTKEVVERAKQAVVGRVRPDAIAMLDGWRDEQGHDVITGLVVVFIEGDDDKAPLIFVSRRVEDRRKVRLQPVVTRRDRAVVHVAAQVRG